MACPKCQTDTRKDDDGDWWCIACLREKCHLAYQAAQEETARSKQR